MYSVVMAMVVAGQTCVQSFIVLCTSITKLWARSCNYCLWPTCKVVMANLVVCCMCVQSAMVEGTHIVQIQPKGCILPEAIFTAC